MTVVKNEGDTITFQCDSPPPLLWFKGNELLIFNDTVLQSTTHIASHPNGTLNIRNSNAIDAGIYRCKSILGRIVSNRYLLVITGNNTVTDISAEKCKNSVMLINSHPRILTENRVV